MSNAIVNVDDFGITIPAPLEPFTSTIIHPANLAIQERQRDARKLTRHELVDIQKEMKALRKLLDEAGFYDSFAEYKLLKQRYMFYMNQAEKLPEGDQRTEQLRLMHQVSERGVALKKSLMHLQKPATRFEVLSSQLKDHQLAMEREQLHQKLNKEMAREAYKWEGILIEQLARLGFSHDEWDPKKKRTFIHKVSFSEIEIHPDQIYYRIFVTRFLLFGTKSALPKHVHVKDLVDEKTLYELSIACQRQVTADVSYKSGAWLCVNRIGTTDGLLNYVTLEQVLASYPHDERELMPIPVGVGEGRNISWIMLAEHPHFLVAGSTGNGKSNFCHAVICSLIQFQSPKELQLCFIDLKEGAEFAAYADIPHLLMPVVTQVEDAINVLAQMDALRAERMKLIASKGCRNILEFNRRFPGDKLPRILIMIDEYARVSARGKEFQAIADRAMGEISALGRASGVQVYVATQTPYARILPGEAKNNMEVKVAFPLDTLEASRSVVGNGDAYRLPDVKGRSLVVIGSTRWPVQTPFVRDIDQERALDVALNWEKPETVIALPDTVKIDVFDENELFDIAIHNFNGGMPADRIYQYAKDRATLNQVREMVKKIATSRKEIEFEGKVYGVKKSQGGGYKLYELRQSSAIRQPEGIPDSAAGVHVLPAEVRSLPQETEPSKRPIEVRADATHEELLAAFRAKAEQRRRLRIVGRSRIAHVKEQKPIVETSVAYVDIPVADSDPLHELEQEGSIAGEVIA